MIASARRPLILAGGGAAAAEAQLIKLADRLDAPLATSLKGKGLFQEHPFNIGIFGNVSTPVTYDVMALADCIISFGASLNEYTSDYGRLMKDKRLIQVDIEPTVISGVVRPEAAIVADAGQAADKIVFWLDEAEIAPSGFTTELDARALRQYPASSRKAQPGCVDYVTALQRIDTALPKDRTLVTDVGRFMFEVWCRVSVPNAQTFVPVTNFGSVGLGLQSAIGAGFASPDRPVVVFCGDGGFMMGAINEFRTAVRQGMDFIVVVANDRAYGAEHVQFTDCQMDPNQSILDWPDFTSVARALGGTAYKADSDEALDAALAALKTRSGPILIELCLDPNDVPGVRH